MAMAAKIAMIATTIISSIRVKPCVERVFDMMVNFPLETPAEMHGPYQCGGAAFLIWRM
jgi:hypothetical protein